MRSRFPLLWLKKRGERRSGSPRWGHSGELLYHSVFVVVGAFACWWHAATVLVPDWRQQQQLAELERVEGFVRGGRVAVRQRVAEAVFSIEVADPSSATDPPATVVVQGTYLRTASDATSPSRRLLELPVGARVQCWVDPADPQRVLLATGVRRWTWLVLLIPVSLLTLGVVGLVRTVLRAGVSAERRHLVAQQASRIDPFSGGHVSVAVATALPPTHDVDDSPGVKLRYRLPIEGASRWRLAGMAVMCVVWNLLVGFFLIGVVADHYAGRPNWAITLFVAPLACGGGWLAYALLRDAWTASAVGVTQVEIATHPLIPGQTGGGVVLQAGQFRVRWLTVSLICEEIATYCEGTDTRTSVEQVYCDLLHRDRKFRIEVDRPYEQAFTFTLPEGAMHSFASPHNEVRWSIEVRGAPMRWPEFRRRFRLCVYPSDWQDDAPSWRPAGAATEEAV